MVGSFRSPWHDDPRWLTQAQRRLGILLLCVSAACSADDQVSGDVAVWTVEPEPVASIGGADDRLNYLVYGVVAANRLSDGRIVVAAQRSSEIKYFDSSGVHLKTAGRAGDGPGEYRGIIDANRLPGDTVMVLSRSPGLTWLAPSGEFARSHRVDWNNAAYPCRIAEFDRHVLRDGTVVSVFGDNFGNPGCPGIPPSPWRESALLLREDFVEGTTDTLAILPGHERNSPNYRVFGRSLAFAFGDERFYASDTGSDSILVLSYTGDTLDVYASPFEEVAVPPSARTEDVRRFTTPQGQEQVGTEYLYPDSYPRLGRLLVDELGYLWAMRFPPTDEPVGAPQVSTIYGFVVQEGGAEWRVLNPGGALVANVRTPPGLFPLEIGEDYVLGVSKDEYDVEAVELYRLRRTGS